MIAPAPSWLREPVTGLQVRLGVSLADLNGHGRHFRKDQRLVDAGMVIVYVARHSRCGHGCERPSFPEIASAMGSDAHSTAVERYQAIHRDMNADALKVAEGILRELAGSPGHAKAPGGGICTSRPSESLTDEPRGMARDLHQ